MLGLLSRRGQEALRHLAQPGETQVLLNASASRFLSQEGAALRLDLWDWHRHGHEDYEIETTSESWMQMNKGDFSKHSSTQSLCRAQSVLVLTWLAAQACSFLSAAQLSGCPLQSVSNTRT